MRLMGCLLLVGTLFVLGTREAVRAEPANPVLAVVESLIELHDAGDEDAFAAVAQKPTPPAWVLAGELLKRGRADVALRLASSSSDVDAGRLHAYLEKTQDEPLDTAGLAATAAADQAFGRRDLAGALEALRDVEPKGLVGLWVLNGRGMAQRFLVRPADAEQTYEQMAEHALALGWFTRAAASYQMAQSLARFRGSLPRAVYFLQKQLAVERRLDSKSGITACLINLGGRLAALGRNDEALPYLRDGIALAREIGHEEFLANGLVSLGGFLARHGDPTEAQAVLEDAMKRSQALGEPIRVANVQSHLAGVAERRFQYAEAISLLEQSRTAYRAARHQQGVAATALGLSGLHHRLGRGDAAVEAAQEALSIVLTLPNPMGQGDARIALAKALQLAGKSEAAWKEAQAAGDLYVAARHLPGMVEVSLVRSKIQSERGAFREALRLASEARQGAEQSRNQTQRLAAEMLRAAALLRLGDLDAALEAYMRVRDGHAARGPSPDLAVAWANMGTIYLARHEPSKAMEATHRAQDLYRKAGARAQASEVGANLGAAWMQLANSQEALRAFEAAAAEAERSGSPEVRVNAILSLTNAQADLAEGDVDELIQRVEAARELAESSSLHARAVEARVFAAGLQLRAKRFEAARDAFRQAGEDARRLGYVEFEGAALSGEAEAEIELDHPQAALLLCDKLAGIADATGSPFQRASAQRMRARAHLRQKSWVASADAVEQSAALYARVMGGIPSALGVSAPEMWQDLLENGVEAARQLDDPARMFRILERTRAGQLLEALGGRDALRGAAVPSSLIAQEREARAAVVEARAALAEAGSSLKTARAARARLLELQKAYADVIGRIQLQSRHRTEVVFPRVPTLAELQGRLGPTDAYVCYAPGRTTLVALVVTKDAARIVDLGEAAAIEASMDAVEAGDPSEPVADALAAIQAFLVTPLRLPEDTRFVLLSPSDRLVLVPFQALLSDRVTLYVPSARALLAMSDDAPPKGEGVLGVGDPVYDGVGGAVGARGGRLSPLPGTRAEVEQVSDVSLLGAKASEKGLREALRQHKRWRAVHLACHGVIDEDRPMASALALSPDAENDGFLGVAEIYRMDFPADVVVLSACDSGRGRIAGAQGVIGFMGAFFFAGADSVVTSLWKVDDEATSALMTKLYELWNPKEGTGVSLAEALRDAQRHVAAQEKWKHPAYWGAWQLWSARR